MVFKELKPRRGWIVVMAAGAIALGLIDMGGVKQVAIQIGTQLEAEQNPAGSAITCVGKVGYCPEEQLYFGLVDPIRFG
jgi:hypothetical protein